MTTLSIRDQVLYIVKEEPGITGKAVSEFFPNRTAAAVALTKLWREGLLRREATPRGKGKLGRPTFNYWINNGEVAPPSKPLKGQPTEQGWHARCEAAQAELLELKNWKQDAIRRFPELAVSETVLKARRIAAKANPSFQQELMAGQWDSSPIMVAVIAALEEVA